MFLREGGERFSELLMKGPLFRALFCPRLRGKSGAAG